MTAMSLTAAVHQDSGVAVLSTGDVRVPVRPGNGDARVASRADQTYQAPTGTADLREAIAGAGGDPGRVRVAPGARLACYPSLAVTRSATTLRILVVRVSKSAADRITHRLGPLLAVRDRKRFAKDTVLIVDGTWSPRAGSLRWFGDGGAPVGRVGGTGRIPSEGLWRPCHRP